MADEHPTTDKDIETLLNILREKDNLIVSLKEASTKRDKLNEQQIRMLAEDNSRKLMEIKRLQSRVNEIEAKLAQKEAELSLYKISEGKIFSKVEEFKVAFEKYKSQVRASLDQIKLAIQEEITKREEYKNKLLDDMRNNYLKLEAQLQELDNYYKEIIADISKKQGLAKRYIRHALNDLQEALSLLDIAHAEFIQPTKIKEDFSKVIEESSQLFEEFREMKGLPSGSMLIKNIENVNVELTTTPHIETIFEEIHNITETGREHIAASAKETLTGKKIELGETATKTGISPAPATLSKEKSDDKTVGSTIKEQKNSEDKEKKPSDKGGGPDRSGTGKSGSANQTGYPEGHPAPEIEHKTSPEEYPTSKKNEKPTAMHKPQPPSIPGEKPPTPSFISSDRTDAEDQEIKKKIGEDVHEVIFKRGRNYAPFNWQEILTDIQLKRFQSFIQSCIKAEKEGNFLKALKLYKTIKEQPGISETIAGKLLEDHIEYLEDLIKRRYALNK